MSGQRVWKIRKGKKSGKSNIIVDDATMIVLIYNLPGEVTAIENEMAEEIVQSVNEFKELEEDRDYWKAKADQYEDALLRVATSEQARKQRESKALVIEHASAYDYNRYGIVAFKGSGQQTEDVKYQVEQLARSGRRFRLVIQAEEP